MATAARQLLTTAAALVMILGICMAGSTSNSMIWNFVGLALTYAGGRVIYKLGRKS